MQECGLIACRSGLVYFDRFHRAEIASFIGYNYFIFSRVRFAFGRGARVIMWRRCGSGYLTDFMGLIFGEWNSRFPVGMTTKKATARATADPSLSFLTKDGPVCGAPDAQDGP